MKTNDKSPHGLAGDSIRAARALSSDQQTVLKALAHGHSDWGFNFRGFRHLVEATGYKRQRLRVVVRQLARKGLAKYSSGLFTEDGKVGGSGYSVTTMGNIVAQIISEDNHG